MMNEIVVVVDSAVVGGDAVVVVVVADAVVGAAVPLLELLFVAEEQDAASAIRIRVGPAKRDDRLRLVRALEDTGASGVVGWDGCPNRSGRE